MWNDVIDHVCSATAAACTQAVHRKGQERLAFALPLAVIAARLRCGAALVGFSLATLLTDADCAAGD